MILQIFATLSLIIGVALGELIATRAFGKVKKSSVYLLNTILFIVAISLIFNSLKIELEPVILLSLYSI